MHSITVLLVNCLNALVRKETPTVLVSGIIVLSSQEKVLDDFSAMVKVSTEEGVPAR
jgi:hypothetical protein